MEGVTIILPAYKEYYLNNTIKDILTKCSQAEIIPVIDGHKPFEPVIEDPRVHPLIFEKNRGQRAGINEAAKLAKTKWAMKMDAHCAVDKDFDKKLIKDAKDNWLMIPRRHSLSDITWDVDDNRYIRDYHYLTFPTQIKENVWYMGPREMKGTRRRGNIKIDDTLTMQGSCYCFDVDYFMKKIYPLDDDPNHYGGFYNDHMEMSFKYWLQDGEVKINKNTWYAHLSKRNHHYRKGYFAKRYKKKNFDHIHNWTAYHWMNDLEPGMDKPFSWLIEKFWKYLDWPKNWKEQWKDISKELKVILNEPV